VRRYALALSLLVLTPALVAQAPRRPRGIYAVVPVEDIINQNSSLTPAQLDAYFDSFYQGLLADPAISGLALQVHWYTLNPNAPPAANAYDWNSVDDAFAQAASAKKTIQLIVTPGFNSPAWVLDQIPSCDGLFESPVQTPPSTCGTATFTGYQEGGDSTSLPLPWHPVYKSAWQTFLTALAARYASNPVLVSIAVAGPTAASVEMTTASSSTATNPQMPFPGVSISPNDMWRQLLAFQYPGMAAYQNSDQAFIDEWDNAIDLFGQIFSGVTLVATTGAGLPNFNQNFAPPPAALSGDCPSPDMECAAVATILSYFMQPTVGGANAKASQTSGMEASRAADPDTGVAGARLLSELTAQFTSPSAQVLGGAQFNTRFSLATLQEGCTSTFPPDSSDTPPACTDPSAATGMLSPACIPQACLAPGITPATVAGYKNFNAVPAADLIPPEQAEYNVLNVYFNGTPVASAFGATPGAAPLNYLQIYYQDIQYAQMNVNAPGQVVETSGVTVSMTPQDLLNLASQKLTEIAEPPEFFIGEVSLGSGVYYLQFPNGTGFGYYNFPAFPILYHYDLGFESFVDALDGKAGAYLYDFASGHWWYTSPSLFPYLYDFTLNAWLYYFQNTKGPRYFGNLNTGKIIMM
jgi:hypothetical protein